jgi:transposase-like protein
MGRLAKHSVDFKARIVLGVMRGEMSMAAAARRHGVLETSIGKWKDAFIRAGCEGLEPKDAGSSGPDAALSAQVDELARALGEAVPVKTPASVLRLAARVENIGAAAYLGQVANIKSKEVLAALSIHAVEARHAAALNTLVGKSSTPEGSFALPMTMDEVLAHVQSFIVTT